MKKDKKCPVCNSSNISGYKFSMTNVLCHLRQKAKQEAFNMYILKEKKIPHLKYVKSHSVLVNEDKLVVRI